MARRSRPFKPKRKKTPLTFNFDNGLLNRLRKAEKDTGFTPGFILGAALQNAFKYRYRSWLSRHPVEARRRAKRLREDPPKTFQEIADYLNRNDYRTSSGQEWTRSSVWELFKKKKKKKKR